jgi:uncharacterized DUF497 family protein
MSTVRFEWDPRKAAANRAKHGVGFDEAQTVFEDPLGLWMPDPDHSAEEDRAILLGTSARLRVLVVVHTYDEARDTVRLISARKAMPAERRLYLERSR